MIVKSSRFFVFLSFLLLVNLVVSTLVMAEPDEPTAPSTWDGTITISSDNGARLPSIAAAPNGKDVIVAYVSQRSADEDNTDPYYHDSSNNGATFPGNPAPINTNNSTEAIDVAIAYDATNKPHALWIEQQSNNDRQLRYANRDNWPSSSTLLSSVTSPGVIFTPRIAASGTNTLNIVWAESSSGIITDIYHARSTNGGSTWPITGVITDTTDLSQSPDLAVANGIIHVVWAEGLVTSKVNYVQGTVNSGVVNWSPRIQISDRSGATNALEPAIFVNGTTVQVAYTNRINADQQSVHYLRCTGGCTTINNWISNNNPVSGQAVGANVGDPFDVASSIVQAGSCTYIYFHGVRTGLSNEQIIGVDSCSGWAASARDLVTSSSIRALNPDLAVQNNWWVYLTFEDKSNETIQFLRNLPALYLPLIVK